MVAAVVTVVVVMGLVLMVLALLELMHATDMEIGARLILAAAVLVVPPLGLLMTLAIRGGRAGTLGAVTIAALTVSLVLVVETAYVPSNHPVQVNAVPQLQGPVMLGQQPQPVVVPRPVLVTPGP